ncbi:ATP-binding protein [Dehalococcoidia bacterium]|nr:ATP-binding protein [Dehalococcoidia bacterium]
MWRVTSEGHDNIKIGAKDSLMDNIPAVISIEPSPAILQVITVAPIKPMDGLSELIDNSIDSFLSAERSGNPIANPTIQIELAGPSEINSGKGYFAFLDNGPGLDLESARNALRAGYSEKDRFDELGLFGVGFNIATGKMGSVTRIKTSISPERPSIEVIVDLNKLRKSNTYDVPVTLTDELGFKGTLVQVSNWHPKGDLNYGFAAAIRGQGLPKIREAIGRRYYSILKKSQIQIFVNDQRCLPYEHCVWDETRSVSHQVHGNIPAKIPFDHVLTTYKTCTACYLVVGGDSCDNADCDDAPLKTIYERIKGWVGIQRFDSLSEFGIDLIRNGRVIRRFEKEPFFEWANPEGIMEREYPIEAPQGYGRIVGEVHMDNVPVDFIKQDFQRVSAEWHRAITFLRGESSLAPKKAASTNEPPNNSPIWKLFQGYRRADPGPRGMFMAEWDGPNVARARRASSSTINEFRQRFDNKEPGYFDDAKWFEKVLEAEHHPEPEMKVCPESGTQVLMGEDECPSCGYLFNSRICIDPDCGTEISIAAAVCPVCDKPQSIDVGEPWRCLFCQRQNPPDSDNCLRCGRVEGEQNPISEEYLLENSNKNDDLSIPEFHISLPGETQMMPIDVSVHTMHTDRHIDNGVDRVQIISFTNINELTLFIDHTHDYFNSYQQTCESAIAMELARFVQNMNQQLMAGENSVHLSLPVLSWKILEEYFKASLLINPETTRNNCEALFLAIKQELPDILKDVSEIISENLSPSRVGNLVATMVLQGHAASKWVEFNQTGQFLIFVDNRFLVELFNDYPEQFFDSKFWSDAYNNLPEMDAENEKRIKNIIQSRYRNYLEDLLAYLESVDIDLNITRRVNNSLSLLERNRV